MGSKETTIRRRLQLACFTNKRNFVVSFITSFILSTIFYTPIYFSQTNKSSFHNLRYGTGGSSASDTELSSTLRRASIGRAAVAIIRVTGLKSEHGFKSIPNNNEVQYLIQFKSHDYPIEAFRGTVCLLGGNVKTATTRRKKKGGESDGGDVTPLDTLKRELNEELLQPDWVQSIREEDVIDDSKLFLGGVSIGPLFNSTSLTPAAAAAPAVKETGDDENGHSESDSNNDGRVPGTIRYLGTTLHSHTSELLQTPHPYEFLCALYEITIGAHQLPHGILHTRGATVQEGRLALLSQDQLLKHAEYSWGYEYTIETYFGKSTWKKQVGTSVSEVSENIWNMTSWRTPSIP